MEKILMSYSYPYQYFSINEKAITPLNVNFEEDLNIDGMYLNVNNKFIGFFVHNQQLYLINNGNIVLVNNNIKCKNVDLGNDLYNLLIYVNNQIFVDLKYNYYYTPELEGEHEESFGDYLSRHLNSSDDVSCLIENFEKKNSRSK